MNLQNRENTPKNIRSKAAFGIDYVSQKWQNTVNVPGLFAKTASFAANDLAGNVKTKLAPARLPANEGRQATEGGLNG